MNGEANIREIASQSTCRSLGIRW